MAPAAKLSFLVLFVGLSTSACSDDDDIAVDRLLLWAIPRQVSADEPTLLVADATGVRRRPDAGRESGCVLFTAERGSLSQPAGAQPAQPEDGGVAPPSCGSSRCTYSPISSTRDARQRAFAIYRVAETAGNDILTAYFYDDRTCPPSTTTAATNSAALVVTVLVGSSADASVSPETVPDAPVGESGGGDGGEGGAPVDAPLLSDGGAQ